MPAPVGKNREDILAEKKSARWKLAMAVHMKRRTGIKNPRLCEFLNLGHPATMSKLAGTYNRIEKAKCPHSKKLKTLNN